MAAGILQKAAHEYPVVTWIFDDVIIKNQGRCIDRPNLILA